MMKIYCDRCGIEILKEYGWLTSAKIYTKEEKYPPSKYNDSWKSNNYLCPSCTKSYIHWLSNSKQKKKLAHNLGITRCSNCNHEIDKYEDIKYCSWCGKEVKWND